MIRIPLIRKSECEPPFYKIPNINPFILNDMVCYDYVRNLLEVDESQLPKLLVMEVSRRPIKNSIGIIVRSGNPGLEVTEWPNGKILDECDPYRIYVSTAFHFLLSKGIGLNRNGDAAWIRLVPKRVKSVQEYLKRTKFSQLNAPYKYEHSISQLNPLYSQHQ